MKTNIIGCAVAILVASFGSVCAQSDKKPDDIAAFRAGLESKLAAGKVTETTAYFKETLKAVKDPRAKKMVREDYLRGMARAGKPLEAYRAFPGGIESFRVLAEQLIASGHGPELRELVKEHEAFFDDDPYLGVYRGQLAYENRKFAEADSAWTAAFKAIDDVFFVEQFQRRRVRARHATGKILEAYKDIPPARDTFTMLADLCVENRQHAELEKLLDAYSQREKYGVSTVVDYLLLMHPDAELATLLKTVDAKMPERFRGSFIHDQVTSHLAKNGKALEAYKAASDKRQTFYRLCQVLRIYKNLKDLRQLIETHRKADPTDPHIELVEGELFWEQRQFEKAITCLKKGASESRFNLARSKYISACYFADKGLKVYEELGFDELVFSSLADLCNSSRDAAGLDALLKARPAGGWLQKDLWIHQANLKILLRKPDEALAIFLAHRKEKDKSPDVRLKKGFGTPAPIDITRLSEESDFLRGMKRIGHGMEVYRIAAFPERAFASMAVHYDRQNDRERLAKLLAEHAVKHPKDPELPTYTGFLELMLGNYRAAEDIFRAEFGKPYPPELGSFGEAPIRRSNLMRGWTRALILQRKTVEQYRLRGGDPEAFMSLAGLCVAELASGELDALLAIHRKNHPKDANLIRYEGYTHFLRGDYDAAWNIKKRFTGHQNPDHRLKSIICLVRLKRMDEAVNLAKDWEEDSLLDRPTPLILAHAAAGDVKETLRLIAIHARFYDNLELLYQDADLGPLLRSDAFREVRERFPDPNKK